MLSILGARALGELLLWSFRQQFRRVVPVHELDNVLMGEVAVLQAQVSSSSARFGLVVAVKMRLRSLKAAMCFGVALFPCSALRCEPGMR